jgi:hypothetical protein
MKLLKERILSDGKCFPGGILKVDNFINHQMDPMLMREMAQELVKRFANHQINKVITIEASGIAPAILVGDYLNVPVLFAKKKTPSTMENMLVTEVSPLQKTGHIQCVSARTIFRTGTEFCSSTIFLPMVMQHEVLLIWLIKQALNWKVWDSLLRRDFRVEAQTCAVKEYTSNRLL